MTPVAPEPMRRTMRYWPAATEPSSWPPISPPRSSRSKRLRSSAWTRSDWARASAVRIASRTRTTPPSAPAPMPAASSTPLTAVEARCATKGIAPSTAPAAAPMAEPAPTSGTDHSTSNSCCRPAERDSLCARAVTRTPP